MGGFRGFRLEPPREVRESLEESTVRAGAGCGGGGEVGVAQEEGDVGGEGGEG